MKKSFQEWLNAYTNTDSKHEQLGFILDFTLLWNLLESKFVNATKGETLTAKKIEVRIDKSIHELVSKEIAFNNLFNSLKSLYRVPGELGQVVISLRNNNSGISMDFHKKDYTVGQEVICIIEKENPSLKEKIFVLLMFAYRCRNNLFHGAKEIGRLYLQKELFDIVNETIQMTLDSLNSQLNV